VPFGPQKVEIFRPPPSNGLRNGFALIKIIKSKLRIKKNKYIGSFMYACCHLWQMKYSRLETVQVLRDEEAETICVCQEGFTGDPDSKG
jgi:hypothetical protein